MMSSSISDFIAANFALHGAWDRCGATGGATARGRCAPRRVSRSWQLPARAAIRASRPSPTRRGSAAGTPLGGNDDAATGMKRFADQLLRHVRPVGIGGVDEIDAKLGQPFQRAEGFRPVPGSPQMPLPVMRMAPKPRRLISISPPILNFPDFAASSFAILGLHH